MSDGVSMTCHRCRTRLAPKDFETGRAITLLGHRYCDTCLSQAILKQRNKRTASGDRHTTRRRSGPRPEPAPSSELEIGQDSRREFDRFIPPGDCTLVLKHEGIRGLIDANLVQLWVDVSEGGLRAVVTGSFVKDDRLRGEMILAREKIRHELRVTVRHAKPCAAYPGCTMIGLQFDRPTLELRAFIRDSLAEPPSVLPETKRRPRPA